MARRDHPLPARLAAAAAAIANARGGRYGAPPIKNILELLPEKFAQEVVDDATAALDAAAAEDATPAAGDRGAAGISVARNALRTLGAQAVVVFDVGQDGTITASTFAEGGGTKSLAIAEWTQGLTSHAIALVPFQTVFGLGFGGVPTPLTPEQRASLSEAGRAYADRYTEETAP